MIPSEKLRQKALPVTKFDTDMLFTLSNSMLKCLDYYKAIGLACTQLGIPMRMIVFRAEAHRPFVMVNPTIEGGYSSNLQNFKEGCLSVPGYWDMIPRHPTIQVKYNDITGKDLIDVFYGYEASIIQHEIEHLDGILFIDHLSSIKKDRAGKKVEHWKRRNNLKRKLNRNV